MDTDQITSAPPQERGAGGKLTRHPPRKPPSTPYSRPPDTTRRRRWISKLVDPAYRLIAVGANRILPSFFSTSTPATALPGPSSATEEEDQGKWQTGEQGHREDGRKSYLHLQASKSTGVASDGDISGKLKSSSDIDLHRQDGNEEPSEKNRLSDIEKLLNGNKFSRDEFNHLVGVLNSRAIDLHNVEKGKQNIQLASREDHKELALTQGLPKVSNEPRHEKLNGVIWGNSTPLRPSKVQDEIGASPIEIARAYMDSRASEAGPSSKSIIQTIDSRVLHGDEAAIKPYDPSPSMKSLTGWPGAMLQEAYVTPQSQRSRYGLHNFPRTPYSRTLLSKSKSKLTQQMQGDFNHFSSTPLRQSETTTLLSKSRLTQMQGDYNHISSTPFRQSETTLYLKDKSKVDASDGGFGSVGPIRRNRHRLGAHSTLRRPAYSSLHGPSQSDFNDGFTPAVKRSSDPDGSSSIHKPLGFEVGSPTVPMHTSLMAKKILEHIDRKVPTPKEKSAELKLATERKNPQSITLSNDHNGSLKLKDVSPYKYDDLDGKKSIPTSEGQGNFHVGIPPKESADKSVDVTKKGTLASDINTHSSIPRLGNDATNTQNFSGSQFFLMKSTEQDVLKTLSSGGGSPLVVNQEKKPLPNSSASKPVLPPISVKKPDSKWTFSSDNGSGFTFPVSASSSVFSEPPTPSIMPLFSTGDQHQSKERSTKPSYSFGLKKSSPALVFSFPSTSNAAVHNDAGEIKFNFGSNDKERLSFSFGKNAVSC
ncbi:hypothetical protein RIF29_09824 [Crotalaria pallida]|uniref:Nuclear pore complex protein NUP1 n=1 Tax=Crotalaria pallida TaxID=3830 RepID=A0AAN9IKM7_CROPI